MKKRLLPVFVLTLLAGGVVLWFALRTGGDGDVDGGEGKAGQSRAFAAAARVTGSAAEGGEGRGRGAEAGKDTKPGGAAEPAATTIDDLVTRQRARLQFLRSAEREPAAKERLAVLNGLHDVFANRCSATRPPGSDIAETKLENNRRRRLGEAMAARNRATEDLTTLTPEAKLLWDENEGRGWKRDGSIMQVTPPVRYYLVQGADFEPRHERIITPIVEDYEKLDDRHKAMMAEWNDKTPVDVTGEVLSIREQIERTRARLHEAVREMVVEREKWQAVGWAGYRGNEECRMSAGH